MATTHPNLPAGVDYREVFAFAGKLDRKAKVVPRQVALVLGRLGARMETRIKANASGRPGPRAITGNYRRSWTTSPARVEGDNITVTVGSNAPQARRLEFGFVGLDVLGRYYDQAPFPHVAPAVAATRPEVVESLAEIAVDLLEDE